MEKAPILTQRNILDDDLDMTNDDIDYIQDANHHRATSYPDNRDVNNSRRARKNSFQDKLQSWNETLGMIGHIKMPISSIVKLTVRILFTALFIVWIFPQWIFSIVLIILVCCMSFNILINNREVREFLVKSLGARQIFQIFPSANPKGRINPDRVSQIRTSLKTR